MPDDALHPRLDAAARDRAESALEQLLTGLQSAEGKIHDSAIAAFYSRAYELAQTESFQERLREACEGQTIGALSYDGGDGLTRIVDMVLNQRLQVFCLQHQGILQCRADGLRIRERQLQQQISAREQRLKAIRKLSGNIAVIIGALMLAAGLGAVAGLNYPAAIACSKSDAICQLRVRAGLVPVK